MMLLVSGTTKTVGRLASQWSSSLGHLLTPKNRNSIDSILSTGLFWAVDNGAFSGFDHVSFSRLLARITGKPRCLFIVCPDVVGDARATIERFNEWHERVAASGPVAFVGQDGQEDLPTPWERFQAFFLGGSTRFKLSHAAADICHEAKQRGKWVHMGRVNSRRRMEIASDIGCDSVDGSSASMFGDRYIRQYLGWLSQIDKQKKFQYE